jgi:hypothetical protein
MVLGSTRGELVPGGHALDWDGPLVVLSVAGDLLIGVSYVLISGALFALARRVHGALPFTWAFVAFGAFIVACGLTHFMNVFTLFQTWWWAAAIAKYATAAVSLAMAVAAVPLIPRIARAVEDGRRCSGEGA